jgi:hypothetical protein
MRWRQLGVLYAMLGILAALHASQRTPVRETDPSRSARRRFLTIAAADVTGLSVVRGDRRIEARREPGGEWVVVDPEGVTVPRDLIAGFVEALLSTEEIERIVTTTADLPGFGLDEHGDRVELSLERGEPVVVTLGLPNPTGTALYARRESDGTVVLIGRRVRDYEDMLYNALPRGKVPASGVDGRVGSAEPLLLEGRRV